MLGSLGKDAAQLILDCLDLLGHVRVVTRHLFLARLELFGKPGNAAGQFAHVRIIAGPRPALSCSISLPMLARSRAIDWSCAESADGPAAAGAMAAGAV